MHDYTLYLSSSGSKQRRKLNVQKRRSEHFDCYNNSNKTRRIELHTPPTECDENRKNREIATDLAPYLFVLYVIYRSTLICIVATVRSIGPPSLGQNR